MTPPPFTNSQMQKLAGKIAVVTGGNSGIGRATAQAFKQAGAEVVIFGRTAETVAEAAQEIGVVGVVGDVSKLTDLDRLFAETRQQYGRLDILFVNAGIAKFAPIANMDEALFDRMIEVNLKGAYFTVQKALPLMDAGGAIILNTSNINTQGVVGASVYAASKAALRSLARTLAAELVERGIRVNAVSPGLINTPIFERRGITGDALDSFTEMMNEQIPMRRFGQPEEIAQAVTFLASSEASYILGAELVVDGGMTQL